MWGRPLSTSLMDLSVFLSPGWQRRRVSIRCLSTTLQQCLGRLCWGPRKKTVRSPLTPRNPSAWGTAGPWKLWLRWVSYDFIISLISLAFYLCILCFWKICFKIEGLPQNKVLANISFFFLLPCRSRCCCISCSWRRSPHQTVNDRASSSPLKYRVNILLCLLETLIMKDWKERDIGSNWACSNMFLNWLTSYSCGRDCLWWW